MLRRLAVCASPVGLRVRTVSTKHYYCSRLMSRCATGGAVLSAAAAAAAVTTAGPIALCSTRHSFSTTPRCLGPVEPPTSSSSSSSPEQPTASSEPPTELIVGDTSVGVQDCIPYIYQRDEFIGRLFPRLRPRTDAGDVLALVDATAGRGAFFYVNQYRCGGRFKVVEGKSLATVAFNSFFFSQPVYEGDLIMLESRVIHAGKSSLGVHLSVRRQAFDAPLPSLVGESFVTMVAIDAHNVARTLKGFIPAVRLTTPEDIARNAQYNLLRGQQHRMAQLNDFTRRAATFTESEVELPSNKKKTLHIPMWKTETKGDHTFKQEDNNVNNAVFGGEILRFLERSVLHCGRVFARNARIFTLGMTGMTFDSPIFVDDLIRCSAKVVCVRNSTMVVRARVDAEFEGKLRVTNRAYFVLVAVDEKGNTFEIPNGIDLSKATQRELHDYWLGSMILQESSKVHKRIKAQVATDKAMNGPSCSA